MDPTSTSLKEETEKWLTRLQEKPLPTHADKNVEAQLVNVRAYVSDCQYFLNKKDFIRAFEAIIYAWGIYETLERLRVLETSQKQHAKKDTTV